MLSKKTSVILFAIIGLCYSFMASAAALSFTDITSAIDVSTAVAAITAIAAIKVGPGFAKWAYGKVIGWFK